MAVTENVEAHDGAISRRADRVKLDLEVGFRQLRTHEGDRRSLRLQLRLELLGAILRLLIGLGRCGLLGGEAQQARLLAFGGVKLDLQNRQLGFCLLELRRNAIARQAGVIIFLKRKHLASDHLVAFLHQHFAHDSRRARRDIDEAAFDVHLASGDRGVGCVDRRGIDLGGVSCGRIAFRRRAAAGSKHKGACGGEDQDREA